MAAFMTKTEFQSLPDAKKLEVLWEWVERLDAGVAHLGMNLQHLHERLKAVEGKASESGVRTPS